AAIQAPSAYKLGFLFRPTLHFNDSDLVRAIKMAFPILVCSWLQPVCNVINTSFASGVEGGISMVSYANKLYIIIVGVFSFVATNLLFPKLSRAEASGDSGTAKKFAASSIKILLYLMIPLAVGIFIVAEPVTRTIYMDGEFTAEDARLTANVLKFFAIGIPFMSANEVLTKLFFAMQKVKAPMLSSAVAIAVNLLLVSLLVNTVGFNGVAIASSVTIAVCACINYALISRGGALFGKGDVFDLVKALAAATLMGVCVYFAKIYLPLTSDLVITACLGIFGMAVYGVCILILSPSEIKAVLKRGK
ncbi:MAG: polysaccharide biosynthesis C-terminal domain-containing protein, partial [Clostridia bacterium]|nr:polysaccharide biosynthesis C-terminal domain-containing protein [Clostridia bacterium]